ncbi:MAG: penicillin-binding transpeptidase domain-containing protein, partial [Chitinophagales bacterium]
MKIKLNILLSFFCVLTACTNTPKSAEPPITAPQDQTNLSENTPIRKTVPAFQQILDSAGMQGSILVYDIAAKTFHSNDFNRCNKGFLPASTFKVPNSIIALETGVVENDSTLFKWDGEKRRLKIWEQDLIFRDAFHFSCVPCYQEIARKIGVERMNQHLEKFNYASGNTPIDSSIIDLFWLDSDFKINQFQQISFLNRFYHSQLPITERTQTIMKRLMVIDENEQYKLSGKTGWA